MSRSSNVLHQLRNREISKPKCAISRCTQSQFYETIVPDVTVPNVSCPNVYVRKFVCDGKFLVCFSKSLHELMLYRFTGPSACTSGSDAAAVFENKFDSFFKLSFCTTVTDEHDYLCKDFCLVTANQEYIILASTATVLRAETVVPSSALQCLLRPENVTFHVVRLSDGKVMDRVTLENDFVHLAHHSGVSLFEDLLSVMSIHNQTIHVFQITSSGKLVRVREIGESCCDDDALLLAQHRDAQQQLEQQQQQRHQHGHFSPALPIAGSSTGAHTTSSSASPSATSSPVLGPARVPLSDRTVAQTDDMAVESTNGACAALPLQPPVLGALKQRLLAFLFAQAEAAPEPAAAIRTFHHTFEQYSNMLMWKMQLLDTAHMLIKFGSLESILGRSCDSWAHTSLLAVYNYHTTRVVNVYTSSSTDLLQVLEQFGDHFRCSGGGAVLSSSSNSEQARESLRQQVSTIASSKQCSRSSAVRHMLGRLPMNPQQYQESPYLDPELFSYDDRAVGPLDRPKPVFDTPIKFMSRRTGAMRFKLSPGTPARGAQRQRQLASYAFHPTLPFVVSVHQATDAVSLHFRQ